MHAFRTRTTEDDSTTATRTGRASGVTGGAVDRGTAQLLTLARSGRLRAGAAASRRSPQPCAC